MTVADFIAKWRHHELKERSAAQEHFLDLCRLVGHKTPAEADPEGRWFTFERGAAKATGGEGWADVWKKGFFGWEYKGPRHDLGAAYRQLLLYFGALENPPLLVTCDTDRIEVHTHFPGTPTKTYELTVEGLADPEQLAVLDAVFNGPDRLRPEKTVEGITEDAAGTITEIAQALRGRGIPPQRVARFLDRLVFCLFAEDVGLLPPKLFSKVIENTTPNPEQFKLVVGPLFAAMATGGNFGAERIAHFNGDLFQDGDVLDLTADEMRLLHSITGLDWSAIDASIFGTLFERALDPDKRSQLGAHYTSRADIETLIEPVVMQPLRLEWAAVRETVTPLVDKDRITPQGRTKASQILRGFLNRLHTVTVLDPACGSGNFLFVTLQKLQDLEKEVIVFAASTIGGLFPGVDPRQLHGIELNTYAHELAQMTVWIGYLQWVRKNGFGNPDEPILRRMTTFECKDAVLDLQADGTVAEPEWPATEFIVSNPPFLGTKKLRSVLGDAYVEALFGLYADRIPNFSDLCCYWFEKTRAQIEQGRCKRAGLIATQGIRGGLNREVLKRIKQTGEIFFAVSDRDWILDGANVHVSMVGFDDGSDPQRTLDGRAVSTINANLTAATDMTQARQLTENHAIGFVADVKAGQFDLPLREALLILNSPNPNGRPNSDVLVPWVNGLDVLRRPRDYWIVDYPSDTPRSTAALYEKPFGRLEEFVHPARKLVKRKRYREYWWLHAEPCDVMRASIKGMVRFLVTPTVSKHRIFSWLTAPTLPDHQLIAFARDDDYFFGVLHSRIHELWARATGTQLREVESGFRYTPSTCFETFPFPEASDAHGPRISLAARELDTMRTRWLNPPEYLREELLTFQASAGGPWAQSVEAPNADGLGTASYRRLVPVDEEAEVEMKKRTLTTLYNTPPTWLGDLHHELDRAVLSAYGLPENATEDAVLAHLLALNLQRSADQQLDL